MKQNDADNRVAGMAPSNPVETEVIHLFAQLTRALDQRVSLCHLRVCGAVYKTVYKEK